MNTPVSLTLDGRIAVIRIDNPPVNALSPDVIDGLCRSRWRRPPPIPPSRPSCVVGAGRTFIAGADIKGLEQLAWGADSGAPEMHDAAAAHRGLRPSRS